MRFPFFFVSLVLLYGVLFCGVFSDSLEAEEISKSSQKPNVLFIISDDLTASALGCYGNEQCKTPNIDRLAKRSVMFQNAYCQFPVCGPSRACIMSGCYPQTIGVTGNGSSSKFTANLGKRPSMSQLFKDHGWYSSRVSKIYHMRVPGDITAGVDGPDHIASWTERFNCKAPEWMTEGKFEHLSSEKLRRDPDGHYGLGFGTAFYVVRGSSDGAEQADHQAAEKAVELINQHHKKPFFLAVGLVRPHVPLVAPEKFFEPYPSAEMKLMERVKDDQADIPKPGLSKTSKGVGLEVDSQKQKVLTGYYAAVSYMDSKVGRILEAVDQHDLWKNTIIIFCADHGYHLGEHDLWQKMSLHEESARIPLMIAAPDIDPNQSKSLVEQIDIFPTLADLANLEVPQHVQGKSLKEVLNNPTHQVRDAAYCLRSKAHLLRTDRWAYIKYSPTAIELYDMKNDPKQFTNLAGKPEFAKIQTELDQQLSAKLTEIDQAKLEK